MTLSNTGSRPGKQVVQLYGERPDSAIERPVRWLIASAPVWAEPGRTTAVTLNVPTRLLA
ncbi:fibronectin type III-like domain-contianing protein [Arthrobacter pascens]|uniref:fibronectin type III-like domain-contianing protein n=1 Tax=Arthrobacter pascens TaxID=1677 RepID=UPI0027D90B5C|nr:fibronectin type III-like domain-contianing protein [Arthrobacter pascens]